ncbi:hypothetical protein [Kribbella catacumbae]|uniref:hypothetical protein n=1 Tax=Kribbella catacumbae TaxID=460086 RepID=UPI00037B1B39|nr:hypothetical protein [Kribbella catacumbae]
MPSDLQRVARGLVECLNEVPQVVAHLQRTAERCRENAALAIVASQGRATVAAQQLDAAARACEEAAHYLSMAPPKAKAWAERLVGASRSSDRPDSQSADRNRSTGGAGDVAERDLLGRVTRTSLPFKPLEDAEGKEPPLITVARKAFEKFRKKQEKDEEQREQPEELEVEILVAESGEVEVADQEPPEERDYEIKVELDAAARELLKSMEEHGKQTWTAATITVTPDHATATFTYPDEPPPEPAPPIIDVHLPELSASDGDNQSPGQVEAPEIDVPLDDGPDFDPAFHPRALGDDFAPGVHDPRNKFLATEWDTANRLAAEGWRVAGRLEDPTVQHKKNPDSMVRKHRADRGKIVEFKTPTSGTANAIKRNINDASEQVLPAGEVVIDGRQVGLTEGDALRAFRRACGQPGKTVADVVHVILGDGRLVTYVKEN